MQIIGHQPQCEQLLQDKEADNIAHAYLFAGPGHIGKTSVAKWFAQKLLLEDENEQDVHRIEKLIHPDLLVLDQLWIAGQHEDWDELSLHSNAPQEHRKKAGLRTDSIGIEDIRTLTDRLYETGEGKHRCCIITRVERMQAPAANALLKILEEPPPGRVFLLTTEAPAALLPTITSRVRTLHFPPLPHAELGKLLQDVSPDDQQFILHLSQGAPGIAKELLADPDKLREERQLYSQAQHVWGNSAADRLVALLPLEKRGEEADRLLFHLSLTLREQTARKEKWVHALTDLNSGLRTNAHRGLLIQQFALSLD